MSEPSMPPTREPARQRDWRFHETGIPCEWAESYRPGGFHPIHFGDILNSRYEIIRKLGNGSLSTVWLALDQMAQRYVVVKVGFSTHREDDHLSIRRTLATNAQEDPNSRFVVAFLDSFVLEGPNGDHPCLVLEPMGPSISAILNAPMKIIVDIRNLKPRRFSKEKVKAILRDVLQGLHFLHSNDIVHGDLQAGNILFAICDLGSIAVEELRQDIANSRVYTLERLDGKIDKWAPKYLVVAKPLDDYMLPDEELMVKIIDMESAFLENEPPQRIVTPVALRAPETILGMQVTRSIDIWSFGCLLFELLTGVPLFQLALLGSADEALNDDHLIQLTEIISPLPDPLRERWPKASRYFGPHGGRLDARPDDLSEGSLSADDQSEGDYEDFDDEEDDFPRENLGPPPPFDSLEKMFNDNKPNDIDEEEEEVIVSLLRWILQYDVSKRPTAVEIQEHPWFRV